MSLTVFEQDGITVLVLEGKIMGGPEAGEINDQIHLLIDRGKKKIALDMSGVEWMNSSGLGILIGVTTTLRNNGGELSLVHISDRVQDLIKITKLHNVFTVYPDLNAALKAMN